MRIGQTGQRHEIVQSLFEITQSLQEIGPAELKEMDSLLLGRIVVLAHVYPPKGTSLRYDMHEQGIAVVTACEYVYKSAKTQLYDSRWLGCLAGMNRAGSQTSALRRREQS